MKKKTLSVWLAFGVLIVAIAITIFVMATKPGQTENPGASGTPPASSDEQNPTDLPGVPDVPNIPDVPDQPDGPGTSDAPGQTDKPGTPDAPGQPDAPRPERTVHIYDDDELIFSDQQAATLETIANKWETEHDCSMVIVVRNDSTKTSNVLDIIADIYEEYNLNKQTDAVIYMNTTTKTVGSSNALSGKLRAREETKLPLLTMRIPEKIGETLIQHFANLDEMFAQEKKEENMIPENYIHDMYGALTENQAQTLREHNKSWNEKYGFQVGLTIVSQAEAGMAAKEYAQKMREQWNLPTTSAIIVMGPSGMPRHISYVAEGEKDNKLFRALYDKQLNLQVRGLSPQNIVDFYAGIDEYMNTGKVTGPASKQIEILRAPTSGNYTHNAEISTDGEKAYIIDEVGVLSEKQLATIMECNANWEKHFGFRVAVTVTEEYRGPSKTQAANCSQMRTELGLEESDIILTIVKGEKTAIYFGRSNVNDIIKNNKQPVSLDAKAIVMEGNDTGEGIVKYFEELDKYLETTF